MTRLGTSLWCERTTGHRSVARGQDWASVRVETRVARLLFNLADKTGVPGDGGTRLGLQLTRQDIADMVGCTLETAIRILSRWQKEGLIKTQEGVITILNRQELGRLLGPG
jgi:CRP-like cAMP-binding protein